MHWSCYLWLWLVVTPAISKIALSGFSSHLPGRLTYKYSKVFFLLWRSRLRYYRWRSLGTSDFSYAVFGFSQLLLRVFGQADPNHLSRPPSIAWREKKPLVPSQGRSTFAIKTIKDCTSIAIKVCYLCWHCFLTRICREQWIRSCCDQWFGYDF